MAKVPSSFKYNFLTSKYLLKKLGEKYLPRDIVYRPKKGFGIPVADWLLTTLKKPMENIVNNPNSFINSIFNKKYTQNLFANHINKKQNNRKLLYTLFTLENWYNSQV
jgi:asparagine synthase (glutamine-hydrolysing)